MNLTEFLKGLAWGSVTIQDITDFSNDIWDKGTRTIIQKECYIVQETITDNVDRRGYGRGDLMPVQYAARQVCKAVEELAELAACFDMPFPLAKEIVSLGELARITFDNQEVWKNMNLSIKDGSAAELADTLIPLLVCAQTIGTDALDKALDKSSADIERGVRNQIAAAPHGAKGGEEE